jgi:hypothetical protein
MAFWTVFDAIGVLSNNTYVAIPIAGFTAEVQEGSKEQFELVLRWVMEFGVANSHFQAEFGA